MSTYFFLPFLNLLIELIPKLPLKTISTAHQNSVGACCIISKPLIIEGCVYGKKQQIKIALIIIVNSSSRKLDELAFIFSTETVFAASISLTLIIFSFSKWWETFSIVLEINYLPNGFFTNGSRKLSIIMWTIIRFRTYS